MLLCVNPYEPPSPAMHMVLRRLAQTLLAELAETKQPRALIFEYVMHTYTCTIIHVRMRTHTNIPHTQGMIV